MKSMLSLILLSSLFVCGYSAVFQERQRVIPGHENQCYDKEYNVFYKKGEEMKWEMNVCGRKICRGTEGREFVYAEVQTCGKIDVPPKCHIKVDLHLSYPNCCEQIECSEILDLKVNLSSPSH